jgi:hypothetical protein
VANELVDLINKITSVVNNDRNIRTALSTVLAVHKPRIFEQGFDAKGQQIGIYSTKPASIAKKNQARQTGQTYFPGGYSEYKKLIGKNPGYVIQRNTDQMYQDYGLVGSSGNYGFGFNNTENYNKSQWMEKHFNKDIYDLSNNEENILADVLVDQLKKI